MSFVTLSSRNPVLRAENAVCQNPPLKSQRRTGDTFTNLTRVFKDKLASKEGVDFKKNSAAPVSVFSKMAKRLKTQNNERERGRTQR